MQVTLYMGMQREPHTQVFARSRLLNVAPYTIHGQSNALRILQSNYRIINKTIVTTKQMKMKSRLHSKYTYRRILFDDGETMECFVLEYVQNVADLFPGHQQ